MLKMTMTIAKMRIWNPEAYSPAALKEAVLFVLANLDASDEDVTQAISLA